jgi:pyrimidine-specific ribonucleoside hydrolase
MTSLIIDTDVALGVHHEGRPRDIDDGFAMVEAINAPDLDLLGITTVYGNAPHEEVYRVAREIVTLKGSNTAVTPGAIEPLPQTGTLPPPNQAARYLIDALGQDKISIAAIGPLTNIALLVHHAPELIGNIEQLIVVAGRSQDTEFRIGDEGPVRDFNFENDVRAAQIVMDSGAPLVLAGFELTSQVCVTLDDLETIKLRNTASSDYFFKNSTAWCRYWTDTFPADTGFHPWDSATIAWLRHPEYFKHEQRGWRINDPDPERAMLECDVGYSGAQVTYCTGFASGGAAAFVKDVVQTVY